MVFHCIECGKNLDESNFYRKVKNRCKDCLKKKFKCDLCGKFFTKKWLTTHINRKHNHNESNSNVSEKQTLIILTITTELFWLDHHFQERHTLCCKFFHVYQTEISI